MSKPYSKRELFASRASRVFSGDALSAISFPLGGIGAGGIGLTGRGGLTDFEVFNRPNIGEYWPRTFPAIFARERGQAPVTRILQGPALPPHGGLGGGDPYASGEGFPHMDGCAFRGEFPFAWIDFASKALPVQVSLEAYSPFVPTNADDSGYPAAVLRYTVTNRTKNPVDTTIAWSLMNPVGGIGVAAKDPLFRTVEFGFGKNVNAYVDEGGVRGLVFSSKKWKKSHPRYGSMALLTPHRDVTVMQYWLRQPWFAPMHEFWDTFSATGKLPGHDYPASEEGEQDAGALGLRARLKPGEAKTLTFYLAWHFPNFEKYWHYLEAQVGQYRRNQTPAVQKMPVWKVYYAAQFKSALDVAQKLHKHGKRLYAATKAFHETLFGSTLPGYVLDAVSSQMAILRTATCTRLTDGTFYGFEGSSNAAGCCEGSCTHVWNYQQTLPFLFPALERSMRDADYRYNLSDDGHMAFRLPLPLGLKLKRFHACGDGQLGGVVKAYRDWKICGDDAWLRKNWPALQKALEYAWLDWDKDRDGVMEGIQHNTYDIEFLGPNMMMGAFYLAALAAAAEMAAALGEPEKACEYRALFVQGRAKYERLLFNGEYYVQRYDAKRAPIHQYGEGCLSDQLFGQCMATLSGLGYVLEARHVRAALRAIVKYNWKRNLRQHENAQRVYALNDEAGLLLCSWPHGKRPAVPFVYSDEVWTGIEYQVATHLIYEGLVEEGLRIVKGCRDRHDGRRRNPWDEFECGHHYARAMAAYGVLLALAGFSYDKGAGILGFAPRIAPEDFKTFWSLDGVWGAYAQKGKRATLEVRYGAITLSRLDLPAFARPGRVELRIGARRIRAQADAYGSVTLPKAIRLRVGQSLTLLVK